MFKKSVGTKGSYLSGGQKQMVGMARAFARGGKVLVLDESTSAMDSILESEMFDSIFNYETLSEYVHSLEWTKRQCHAKRQIYQTNGLAVRDICHVGFTIDLLGFRTSVIVVTTIKRAV